MALPNAHAPHAPAAPDAAARRTRFLLIAAAACLLAACVALPFDVTVARWLRTTRPPRELVRLLNFSEAFAHGTGVAALLVAALALDRSLRPGTAGAGGEPAGGVRRFISGAFAGLVATSYAGGLLADVVKAVVDRVRPRAVDFSVLPDTAQAGLSAGLAAAFDTFGTAALAQPGGHAEVNSFPSGHAAVAAGFAAALSARYPHAAWCFAAFAVLAAAQRVVALAHYPSDVACGAALGLAAAAACLSVLPGAASRQPG